MIFKNGVRIEGIKQITFKAMCQLDWYLSDVDEDELRITSVTDDATGRLPNSKHKTGEAFDCNRRRWTNDQRAYFAYHFQCHLDQEFGPNVFDVVHLNKDDSPKNHIHIEYDPK